MPTALRPPRLPKHLPLTTLPGLDSQEIYAQIAVSQADYSSAAVDRVVFEQVTLRSVLFLQTRLGHVRIQDSRLEKCDFSGVTCENARIHRVEWNGCRLLGSNLLDGIFEDALFHECSAEKVVFAWASFKRTRFEGCNLQGAVFTGADLSGVIFEHCDLTGADFCNAKLKGTDFRTALLNGLRVGAQDFAGAIIAPEQALQVVGLLGVEVKEPDDPLNII